jgi:hypothetical protein
LKSIADEGSRCGASDSSDCETTTGISSLVSDNSAEAGSDRTAGGSTYSGSFFGLGTTQSGNQHDRADANNTSGILTSM